MRQHWLASSYPTADILAAFSRASAEADAIDLLLHAGPTYCPDDDTRTQARHLRPNDDPRRRIDRVAPVFLDALAWLGCGRSRLSQGHETGKIPTGGSTPQTHESPSSAELISHFAFPHAGDRERGAGCAFRTRNDPA